MKRGHWFSNPYTFKSNHNFAQLLFKIENNLFLDICNIIVAFYKANFQCILSIFIYVTPFMNISLIKGMNNEYFITISRQKSKLFIFYRV